MINYRHSGSLGDVIYALPAIISQGLPAKLYLKTNVNGNYYYGCKHPSGKYRMSTDAAIWLLPLLNSQEGLSATIDQGEVCPDIDLDQFRRLQGVNFQWGSIPKWFFYFVEGWFDLTKPWLKVNPNQHNTILVNRTGRYQNSKITYKVLNEIDCDVSFVGLSEEFTEFLKEVPKAKYFITKDALVMAQYIAGCRFFIGNQSCAWSIAEGLKVPRVLETCTWATNVIPMGGQCYDAINQKTFDWAVKDCWSRNENH